MITGLLVAITTGTFAQLIDRLIDVKEVTRIETTLSSDDMQGRKVGTAGLQKAANFIAGEFKSIGLQPFDTLRNYMQAFTLLRPRQTDASLSLDGQQIDPRNVIVITSKADVNINPSAHFEKVTIKAGSNFSAEVQRYAGAGKSYVVFIDTSFARNFPRIANLKRQIFKGDHTVAFVLTATNPSDYNIKATPRI